MLFRSLRGAPVRNARAWSAAVDEALRMFVQDSDVVFTGHQWPVWGTGRIAELLALHRDLYRYIHDETLRLANHGYTPNEIAALIELPETLSKSWATRGTYGALESNAKGVYQHYLGWFDANPANLDPLPPAEAGQRYVEALGGLEAAVNKAQQAVDKGEYRWAAELLKHVLAASPENEAARLIQAEVFEQLGYQAESSTWRNFYLIGAQELRLGFAGGKSFNIGSPDVVAGMTVEMLADHMAVRLNGPAAGGLTLRVGLRVTDVEGVVTVATLATENGVLQYVPDSTDGTSVVLDIPHAQFAALAFGTVTLDELADRNEVSVEGSRADLEQLLEVLDTFTGVFNVVTPNLR